MVERNMLPQNDDSVGDVFEAPMLLTTENQNVVYLDDYRPHLERGKTVQQIAAAALTYTKEGKFLPEPLTVHEHANGNTTVIFSESERGYYGDIYARLQMRGWSGGPETERIIAVQYDTESDTATADYVLPRNHRYVQGDVRIQQRMKGYVEKIQALRDEVRNQPRE